MLQGHPHLFHTVFSPQQQVPGRDGARLLGCQAAGRSHAPSHVSHGTTETYPPPPPLGAQQVMYSVMLCYVMPECSMAHLSGCNGRACEAGDGAAAGQRRGVCLLDILSSLTHSPPPSLPCLGLGLGRGFFFFDSLDRLIFPLFLSLLLVFSSFFRSSKQMPPRPFWWGKSSTGNSE